MRCEAAVHTLLVGWLVGWLLIAGRAGGDYRICERVDRANEAATRQHRELPRCVIGCLLSILSE